MTYIGVTGHRQLENEIQVRQAVQTALVEILSAFPGETCTMLSSLAEGADRLAAWLGLEIPGSKLIAILPLTVEDYLTDFSSEQSRMEFFELLHRAAEVVVLPPAPTRTQAYLKAGELVLAQSEVLIAVWDGQEARGEGGTADIVARARKVQKPLVWIQTNLVPDASVNITWENFLRKRNE